MLQAKYFISVCTSRGYTFFTGVPCSFLKPLINCVIQSQGLQYIAASSEGEAVGISAGAYLAGSRAVVMCQNSGLGNMVNPLSSLNFPFRIPALLVVTQRGEPGLNDEPQHELMGQITGKLLDALRIQWEFFPTAPDMVDIVMDRADRAMETTGLPFALILKKGVVAKNDLNFGTKEALHNREPGNEGHFKCAPPDRIRRLDAIRIIRELIPEEYAIVATTGKIGRELFTLGDCNNHLYVVGSMGCASGIGLGIQQVLPKQGVLVLDGDGAVLMKMGTLAAIGYYKPLRFIHVILDNESYESTGSQYSVSSVVDFCNVASACGYRQCRRADTETDLKSAVNRVKELSGPSLIHVKVACGSAPDLERPILKPFEVKERFMRFLQSNPVGI